jgi:hypothetical protein
MDMTALLLSRIQFAFTITFHIIFPSFTIGLAAWLTVIEAMALATGRPVYRVIFEFWLKIFGIAFGMGVVSAAKRMLGDKAYDSAELREELHERGTKPIIPTAATGSNRSALASASTSFAGASSVHSTG